MVGGGELLTTATSGEKVLSAHVSVCDNWLTSPGRDDSVRRDAERNWGGAVGEDVRVVKVWTNGVRSGILDGSGEGGGGGPMLHVNFENVNVFHVYGKC